MPNPADHVSENQPRPVWRGDTNGGFQTQCLGAYPDASDVADKDNIYLSNEGWVYRHFKNEEKTKYWDEVIWAGNPTDPPTENDPVDAFTHTAIVYPDRQGGTVPPANPTFIIGDGFQYVEGPYPHADPDIGTVSVLGPDTVDTTEANEYSVSVSGTLPSSVSYAWSTDPAGGVFAPNATDASPTITFADAGTYDVICTVTDPATHGFSTGTKSVVAAVHATSTIGTVSVSGRGDVDPSESGVVYTASYTGDADEGSLTFAWSSTPAGVTFANAADPNKASATFPATKATYTITCEISGSSADVSDTPQSGSKTGVVSAYDLGTITIAGFTDGADLANDTATGALTVTSDEAGFPPTGTTYAWTSVPTTGVTFTGATAASATFKSTTAGDYKITCTVTNANAGTSPVASQELNVTVLAA